MTRKSLLEKFSFVFAPDGEHMQFENQKEHHQHTDHAHYWAHTKSC